jgi:ribosomal subunit interface protein
MELLGNSISLAIITTIRMTFPMISYKYNNTAEADALAKLTDQKLEPLGKFIADGATAVCEVEFEKVNPQQQGKIHRVEVNLSVAGALHRAEAVEDSFEQAIDEVRDELDKKLRRSKDKSQSLLRRAGQQVKEKFFRGS